MQVDILVVEHGDIRMETLAASTIEGITTLIDSFGGQAIPQFVMNPEEPDMIVGMAANPDDGEPNVLLVSGRLMHGPLLIIGFCEHGNLRQMAPEEMALFRIIEHADGRKLLIAAALPFQGGLLS